MDISGKKPLDLDLLPAVYSKYLKDVKQYWESKNSSYLSLMLMDFLLKF